MIQKIYKWTLFYFVVLISLNAFSKQESNFGLERTVIITGTIINFDNTKDQKSIQIIRRDFFDNKTQENYISVIDEKGAFRITFLASYQQEFYLKYGDYVSLVCNPGDSLYLEIDSKILLTKKSTNNIKFPTTELGKANSEINKFRNELPNEKYIYQKANEAETNKTPNEFKFYIQQRNKEYSDFLKEFISKNNTTELFNKWSNDHLKYESWNDLMRYRWTHPEYNKIELDSFQLPNDYFSFLLDYNMNDKELFSISHTDFLHEFSMYSHQNPKDSIKKAIQVYKEKGAVFASDILKNMIRVNSFDFTCELFLTKFYINMLNGMQLAVFDSIYDPSSITQHYFLNTISKEYDRVKIYLSNQNTEGANLLKLKSTITKDLIDSISLKFKNKVIYIDFWAPWCSPCMGEMPFSKEIQEYFKNENVVFLFLANRCNKDSWKSTIANKKLTGEHILLSDDQFNVISTSIGITGIPHYTLIDKNGNVVLKNAPRPSEKNDLIKEIERQLKK